MGDRRRVLCMSVATIGMLFVPASASSAGTTRVSVRPLTPPLTASPRVGVDMFNAHAQLLSWTHAGSGFVEIYPPNSPDPYRTRFPATGRLAVQRASLPIGRSTYSLAYCEQPAVNAVLVCSPATRVTYVVGPAQFSGPWRKFSPARRDLQLSWSGSGNVWHLSAPSLGLSEWLTTPTFTIPAANMTAGAHEIAIVSCNFNLAVPRCSNRFDVRAAAAGTVHFSIPSGTRVAAGQVVGQIARDSGGARYLLTASRAGEFRRLVANGSHLRARAAAGLVISADAGHTEVIAGASASVPTWTTASWQRAFTAQTYDNAVRPATGSPLDVTFDSAGGIWQVGEFSQAIAHVQGAILTDAASPVGQDFTSAPGPDAQFAQPDVIAQAQDGSVRGAAPGSLATRAAAAGSRRAEPYAVKMFGIDVPTSMSVLGERVIDTGSAVWYTQGGELFYNGVHPNHSTLIKVNYRSDTSSAAGSGVCAIDVPGNNNQVIGIAYDRTTKRVWFTESHAGRTSALDWFMDDGSIPCDNHLDYSNPSAVAAVSAANHCRLATQTGCIHQIDLPASAGVAGHITIDPFHHYAWFVDFSGRALDRYPLNGGVVQSFPLPPSLSSSLFNGFPWEIQANATAVYVNRYSDNTLLRFDTTITNPATRCTALTDGRNPCIDELFLPMPAPDLNAHSIALVGNKLWFTIANESNGPTDPNASTFGYIDTTSWAAGTPTGTYYDNLSTLGPRPPGANHSFRGIAVDPSGHVALADSGYKMIVSLTPR